MKSEMITEQDLLEFGFERHNETPESTGDDHEWHYYTLDIEDFCFITNSSDEVEDGNWKVYIFNYGGFEFNQVGQVASMVNILKENIKKVKGND